MYKSSPKDLRTNKTQNYGLNTKTTNEAQSIKAHFRLSDPHLALFFDIMHCTSAHFGSKTEHNQQVQESARNKK